MAKDTREALMTNLKRYFVDARKLAGVAEHPEGELVFYKDIEHLLKSPVEPSLKEIGDAVECVLRVEITSDTHEKVDTFRQQLCDAILAAPAALRADVMVTIHGDCPEVAAVPHPGNPQQGTRANEGSIPSGADSSQKSSAECEHDWQWSMAGKVMVGEHCTKCGMTRG